MKIQSAAGRRELESRLYSRYGGCYTNTSRLHLIFYGAQCKWMIRNENNWWENVDLALLLKNSNNEDTLVKESLFMEIMVK